MLNVNTSSLRRPSQTDMPLVTQSRESGQAAQGQDGRIGAGAPDHVPVPIPLHLLTLPPDAPDDTLRPQPSVWASVNQLRLDIGSDMRDLSRMVQHYSSPANALEGVRNNPRPVIAAVALGTAGTLLGVYYGAIR